MKSLLLAFVTFSVKDVCVELPWTPLSGLRKRRCKFCNLVPLYRLTDIVRNAFLATWVSDISDDGHRNAFSSCSIMIISGGTISLRWIYL